MCVRTVHVTGYNFFLLSRIGTQERLEDLQRDSAEDVVSGKTSGLELPFQENVHFKKFAIMHRFVESKEEVKRVLNILEKEA